MPEHDSLQSLASDAEELLAEILSVVCAACQKRRYYPDQSEIDGLVSRIAVKLLDKEARLLRSFEGRSERRTWLFTIADRFVRRWIRSRKKMIGLNDAPPLSFIIQPDQEERVFSREVREKLLEVFCKLTLREQKLLCLWWLQELSAEEIAKEMGIKKESVYKEKSDLKKKIRMMIEGE